MGGFLIVPNQKNFVQITVIIPVYNCKEYLENAVYSVLNQPYSNIFLVLVDDGSTDGSAQICDKLESTNSRIKVFHQSNAGVSKARNVGIEYVLGHKNEEMRNGYIAFLDADDCWSEKFFEKSTEKILQSNYDLIGFLSCNCNSNLSVRKKPKEMPSGLYYGGQQSLWFHSKQSFAAMLYSCEFLRKRHIRFFEGLDYSEDKIFSMQCMYLAKSILLQNRLLYLIRCTGHSAMSRRKFGVLYYVPIIDGYIKLYEYVNQYEDVNLPFTEGALMANIYIMNMINEHYQFWHSKKTIDELFVSRPEYIAIEEATGKYSFLKPNTAFIAYKKHPFLIIAKDYMLGIIKFIKRTVKKILCHIQRS